MEDYDNEILDRLIGFNHEEFEDFCSKAKKHGFLISKVGGVHSADDTVGGNPNPGGPGHGGGGHP